MAFWSWLVGAPQDGADVVPNDNGPDLTRTGDPYGVEFESADVEFRSMPLPFPVPSPWAGWPADWAQPNWGSITGGINGGTSSNLSMRKLIDIAWTCIDINASILGAMPVYRMRGGKVIDSASWQLNPDEQIYSAWYEFARQLFWDYQLGEAFVLEMARGSDDWPLRFRVVPPWLVNVDLVKGKREYSIGGEPVTDKICHIRYHSSTIDARGHGPLEAMGARITLAGVLQRYVTNLCATGGSPQYWIHVDRKLNKQEADDLLNQWVESRTRHAGHPALLSGGADLKDMKSMSAHDLTLLELTQFTEARIATACGVPPFLAGLPGGGESRIYSNVSQIFDFHDRSSLRPKAEAVMQALSQWALPAGQSVELNRDEYNRPQLLERSQSYQILFNLVDDQGRRAIDIDEIRALERLHGEQSATALTGGEG